MDGSMEVQTSTSSLPASEETKAMIRSSPYPPANNNGELCSFDCAICYETLNRPGPPLHCFTFGKLLINVSQLPFFEREHIYREFGSGDQCFKNGSFDCDKILSTICGHVFHSGCIREWFFTKRMERFPKCPFCNRVTNYVECRVLHPISCKNYDNDRVRINEEEAEMQALLNETEYSDISCTSSSWPSDNESSSSDDSGDHYEDEAEDVHEEIRINSNNEVENDFIVEENVHVGTPEDDQQVDSVDILYFPVYAVTNESDDVQQNIGGQLRHLIDCIINYNLVYAITVMDVLKQASGVYRHKKEEFLADLAVAEDEYLEDMENDEPVPFGYELVCSLLITWLWIWTGEKYVERKEDNEKTITSSQMMIVCCIILLLICVQDYASLLFVTYYYFARQNYQRKKKSTQFSV